MHYMAIPLSFRWEEDFVRRVDVARGDVPRSAWVRRAVEVALAGGGAAPVVPTAAEELEAPHIGSVREMQSPAAPVRPVYDPAWDRERQRKLNEAKYGRKR